MNQEPDRFRFQIAKDFATAYIANQMGVTFKTAQSYVDKETVGEFWLFLADIAIKGMMESQGNWFKTKSD